MLKDSHRGRLTFKLFLWLVFPLKRTKTRKLQFLFTRDIEELSSSGLRRWFNFNWFLLFLLGKSLQISQERIFNSPSFRWVWTLSRGHPWRDGIDLSLSAKLQYISCSYPANRVETFEQKMAVGQKRVPKTAYWLKEQVFPKAVVPRGGIFLTHCQIEQGKAETFFHVGPHRWPC